MLNKIAGWEISNISLKHILLINGSFLVQINYNLSLIELAISYKIFLPLRAQLTILVSILWGKSSRYFIIGLKSPSNLLETFKIFNFKLFKSLPRPRVKPEICCFWFFSHKQCLRPLGYFASIHIRTKVSLN